MFIKLDKTEVFSVIGANGRDYPIGDIYINSEYISHIDGNVVVTRGFGIACNETGIAKVLSVIRLECAE